MRITAAITGSLNEHMRSELRAATTGVQAGIRKGGRLLKGRLRRDTKQGLGKVRRRDGFKGNLSKTWQDRFFKNRGLNAADLVYTKAPHIIAAHLEGATIRPATRRFLAIPTDNVPGRGRRRRERASPSNWPEAKYGPLRYVPAKRGRPALLVADVRVTKQGRVTTRPLKKTVRERGAKGVFAPKRPRGQATLVMFILKKQVRLKKRLDLGPPVKRVADLLPTLILREYRDNSAVASGQGRR